MELVDRILTRVARDGRVGGTALGQSIRMSNGKVVTARRLDKVLREMQERGLLRVFFDDTPIGRPGKVIEITKYGRKIVSAIKDVAHE